MVQIKVAFFLKSKIWWIQSGVVWEIWITDFTYMVSQTGILLHFNTFIRILAVEKLTELKKEPTPKPCILWAFFTCVFILKINHSVWPHAELVRNQAWIYFSYRIGKPIALVYLSLVCLARRTWDPFLDLGMWVRNKRRNILLEDAIP